MTTHEPLVGQVAIGEPDYLTCRCCRALTPVEDLDPRLVWCCRVCGELL